MTSLAFPKRKPFRDPRALTAFKRANPYCAIQGCGRHADPHHLVKRSQGGGDEPDNLLPLCWEHHTGAKGIHTLGVPEWLERCAASLEPATLARVVRVLKISEEE